MATTTTITKLLFRRGNDADRKKTILASGEPGFALDTGRFYIGDGSTPGGHPVIAVSTHHLNFVDEIGTIEGDYSRHELDLYVPGLSATLAGDRREPEHLRYPKLFHPTDRILRSDFPLELTGQNDTNAFGQNKTNSIFFTGDSSDAFTINRLNPGLMSMMDGVFSIDTSTDPVSIKLGGEDAKITLEASTLQFEGGSETHVEDNTFDLNVPIQDGAVLTPGQSQGITSEDTGIYFAHSGYLSAGGVFIGRKATPTSATQSSLVSWNTINLQPTVYLPDWVDTLANQSNMLARLRDGTTSYGADNPNTSGPVPRGATFARSDLDGATQETALWRGIKGPNNLLSQGGAGYHQHMGSVAKPKPLHIQSVRPGDSSELAGNASPITSVYETATTAGVPAKLHASGDYEGIPIANRGQPNPWAGNSDLIFETGLIVYGPGDRDLQPDVNGYLINQSLDSYAVPTFQGLVIEGPNSKPMQVDSGGTGRKFFHPGALLAGNGNTPNNGDSGSDCPLHEIRCPQMVGGNPGVLTGTSTGAVVSASMNFMPSQWISRSSNTQYTGAVNCESNPTRSGSGNPGGTISITTNFAPTTNTVGSGGWDLITAQPKEMFFDKYTYIKADTGSPQAPGRFDAGLKFIGDSTDVITKVAGKSGAQVSNKPNSGTQWNNSWGPTTNIEWDHVKHADAGGLWSKGSGGDDVRSVRATTSSLADGNNQSQFAAEPSGNGVVISNVTFNKAGHLRQINFKNLDARFARMTHMGGATNRSGGRLQLPTLNGNSISTSTGVAELAVAQYTSPAVWDDNITGSGAAWARDWMSVNGSGPSGGSAVQVIDSIEFNDYGTVHNIVTTDLRHTFFNKREIGDIIDQLGIDFQVHETKHNNWPLRRDVSSSTSANIMTTWNRGSSIRFDSDSSGTPPTSIQQSTASTFEIDSGTDIRMFYGSGRKFGIYRSNTNYEAITCTDSVNLFHGGAIKLSTRSNGLLLHGSGDPATKGNSVTQMDGCSKYSIYSKYARISEIETDAMHSLTFTSNNSETYSGSYESLYKDNVLKYNPSRNILYANYFQGDGRWLDMSLNTTIPPTVELQTAGTEYYRVVGCTADRHKIFDRDNTLKYHGTEGHLLAKGDIYAYYNFSDERLKHEITTLDPQDSLNRILALKPVHYEWKEAPEKGTQIGLLAQQVEEVVPEVVETADRFTEGEGPVDRYKRVDYDKLVPLLIDSIKVLTSRVEELESQLKGN